VSAPGTSGLLKLAEIACEAAIRAGAEFADAAAEHGESRSVSVEKNAIKSSDARRRGGISVRAFFSGGTGWSSASGLTEETARQAGAQAAELARAAEADPDFVDLVEPAGYPTVGGLYDPRLAEVAGPQIAAWITENIDAARGVADDALVSGGASVGWGRWALANSRGVRVSQESTRGSVSVEVVVRRGDDVGSFYDWDAGRSLSDIAPENLGAKAAEEALRYLKSRVIKTATLPVVFGPRSGMSLLSGLCGAASAEEVQRNRSFLIGKLGERVASEHVTLVDDAVIAGGLGSSVCDGDGFPHRRVTLVERGVLKTYLHNHYTANKGGVENTGHSTRGGISTTNVIPSLGTKTAAEIIAEVDDGIYVTLGHPSPDTASGQISAMVDSGFRIAKGKLTFPLKNTMFAGHGLELLANVDAISSDYRTEPGMVLPTVRVQGVRVAGGG
jgi:PmbA protein